MSQAQVKRAIIRGLLPWFEEQATTGEKWVAHDANRAAEDVYDALDGAGFAIVPKEQVAEGDNRCDTCGKSLGACDWMGMHR